MFLEKKKENILLIKDVFDNIYITLKNFCDANIDIKIPKEFFEKFESLLFNYINTYKIGFNDIFINEIHFISNNNNLLYKLMFIKMYLFNFIVFLHFQIFENNDKHSITSSKILKNNLTNISQFLLNNNTNINDTNKIIYFKCFILSLISLKTLDNNNEIIIPILNKICEENEESKLNINYIFHFFDILSKGDLFYVIKFFNIYFDSEIKEENEDIKLNIFKLFGEKAVKSILENRENFTFMNIMTLGHTLLNKKLLPNEKYIPIIKSTIHQFMDLNEKKIWLLLKLSMEILFNNINDNKLLLEKYQDIIIEISIIRETRGDDSFMIQTYPLYIKSPFNLKINKILPYDETISKYGLYK